MSLIGMFYRTPADTSPALRSRGTSNVQHMTRPDMCQTPDSLLQNRSGTDGLWIMPLQYTLARNCDRKHAMNGSLSIFSCRRNTYRTRSFPQAFLDTITCCNVQVRKSVPEYAAALSVLARSSETLLELHPIPNPLGVHHQLMHHTASRACDCIVFAGRAN
nr:hypothetical protein CFP56_41362 [Quercus suber]